MTRSDRAPAIMTIQGDLRTLPFKDVLNWLEGTGKTGTLSLAYGSEHCKIGFSQGRIASATQGPKAAGTPEEVREILSMCLDWPDALFEFGDTAEPPRARAPRLALSVAEQILFIERARQTREMTRPGPAALGMDPLEKSLRLAIVSRLLKNDLNVPLLPTVVNKVLEVTGRDDFALADLSNVILTDQVIAARVIKQANSALYGSSREIDSLKMAVLRLGAEAVTNIVLALSLQSLTRGSGDHVEKKTRIWRHSLLTALFSRAVATTLGHDAERAFLCGLLANLGKIVLLSTMEDLIAADPCYRDLSDKTIDGIIDSFHLKVGSVAADKWSLPTAISDTMQWVESPASAGEFAPTAAVIALAGQLAATFDEHESSPAAGVAEAAVADEVAELSAARLLELTPEQLEPVLADGPKCAQFAQKFLEGEESRRAS